MKTNQPLSEFAYRQLLQRLVDGRIGSGQRVSQQKLADELSVGLTPIREAIRRMCDEGLLYQKPQSGTFVAEPDRRTLIEAYEVRCALETQAVESAAGRISKADLDLLDRCCKRTQKTGRMLEKSGVKMLDENLTREFLEADMLYHHSIMQAAGNVYAMKIVSTGQIRNRAFGYRSHFRDLAHIKRVFSIHTKIIKALRRGDGKVAGRFMGQHINQSMAEAVEAFDRNAAMENPVYSRTRCITDNIKEILSNSKSENIGKLHGKIK